MTSSELNDGNINNIDVFQIIHGDNKNNDIHGDVVFHELMQKFNNNSNKDSINSGNNNSDITLNESDVNYTHDYYAIIQHSQNEILNVMIRNLKQNQKENNNESRDEDEK